MVPRKSTAEEVPFEWSHHGISSTDSKVRTTLHGSIGMEYVTENGGNIVSGRSYCGLLVGFPFLSSCLIFNRYLCQQSHDESERVTNGEVAINK